MTVKSYIEKQIQQSLAFIVDKREHVDGISPDLWKVLQRKKTYFKNVVQIL